ncbi:protein CUSTOS isoform X1 [Perognathus longimembris pacificus]|uniref:protein CUSTOS isoform X1 n=1 Tax=Perognathus longimembris pacificus TaxID=214514 RepID=UPI0020184313|nr:protein CUSTOS isoform X1 [Perognathus longimembris pacificus]
MLPHQPALTGSHEMSHPGSVLHNPLRPPKMAAPSGTMSDSESSSSSDEEELARCREAAMPAWGLEQHPRGAEKPRADAAGNQLPTSRPSLRHKVDEHEQDGNELQTTPEFRAHVAKKLGALLDSSITISEVVTEPRKAEGPKVASEDDGFRLFFTSVPGGPEKEASPRPQKRRPPSSSSEESDEEWRRCQEAAVSASDILQESAIHGPGKVEEESKQKKRKLKKKATTVANSDLAIATTPTTGARGQKQGKESGEVNGGQAALGTKKKKKAKKATAAASSPCPAN